MASLTRLADPARWVLTLDEARAQTLAVDEEDLLLQGLIEAAHDHLETATRRTLCRTQLAAVYDGFPRGCEPLYLPAPPLVSVESLTYTDEAGATQTLTTPAHWWASLQATPGAIVPLADWPATREHSTVRVEYTAGYLEPPARAKHAARLLVAHWYLHREAVAMGSPQSVPHGVMALVGGLKWGDYS